VPRPGSGTSINIHKPMGILEHLSQKVIIPINWGGVDLSISNGVITLWLSVLLVFGFYFLVSRKLQLVPGKAQGIAEVLVLFIKNDIADQITHDREKWVPFIIAIFSFILANNLLGLIPGISSATSNINTTAALALIVFFVVQITGIAKHGMAGYFKSLVPEGIPAFILPFIIPIEIVSNLAKPFSLAVRLFANMFAGHAVMLVLISLIFMFKSYFILPLPVLGDVIMLMFEIFVAFIQAFIFTFLTTLYIATALEGH
jgi:F-type H+-transporting ATPase subunit a